MSLRSSLVMKSGLQTKHWWPPADKPERRGIPKKYRQICGSDTAAIYGELEVVGFFDGLGRGEERGP
jgi:hypothetical protein